MPRVTSRRRSGLIGRPLAHGLTCRLLAFGYAEARFRNSPLAPRLADGKALRPNFIQGVKGTRDLYQLLKNVWPAGSNRAALAAERGPQSDGIRAAAGGQGQPVVGHQRDVLRALGSSHHRIYVVLLMTGVRTRLYRFCRSVGKLATLLALLVQNLELLGPRNLLGQMPFRTRDGRGDRIAGGLVGVCTRGVASDGPRP